MFWSAKVECGPQLTNHAAVVFDDIIYSFGGHSVDEDFTKYSPININSFDTETNQWKRVEVDLSDYSLSNLYTHVPYQRFGHTVISYNGKAYLWGGRSNLKTSCSSLFAFDPKSKKWSSVLCGGSTPLPRDGHTAVLIDDKMYIFGGFESATQRLSRETYFFDFKTSNWSELATKGNLPSWRDFHTACAYGSEMYVFGGRSDQLGSFLSNREVYNNNVAILDVKSGIWRQPSAKGDLPHGRRSHSAWIYNKKMHIFGGYFGPEDKHFNDLYEFDIETNKWNKLRQYGYVPSERRRHYCVIVGNQLFLFGGTRPDNESISDSLSNLIDLSDLYVMSNQPSLETLCMIAVIGYGLHNLDVFPKTIRNQLSQLNQNDSVSQD